jgi:hypothetical protein
MLGTWTLTNEQERTELQYLIANMPTSGRYVVTIAEAPRVGPFIIHRREGVPPPGLAWIPTLEPELSDDEDTYRGRASCGSAFTECARKTIHAFGAKAQVIVEIGVADDLGSTVSLGLMNNRAPGAVYIGIDKVDRRHYNQPEIGIHIIHGNSADRAPCFGLMDSLEREHIDLLFIDGWHSVNQCLADWRYTERLAPDGVVLLHDSNHHPGPAALYAAIDDSVWDKRQACPALNDYGLAIVRRK